MTKNGCQELTSTKENLKQFIERWEEHPNSPYIFESASTLILPVHDNEKNTSSGFSSRGCSPSPCESLSSNVDLNEQSSEATIDNSDSSVRVNGDSDNGIAQTDRFDNANGTGTSKQNKGYLQSFDRRHSDSNYITRNRTSSLDKVDLADEIKKLSDRLMILSSINDELQELNKNGEKQTELPSAKSTETSANVNASELDDSSSTTSTEHNEKIAMKNKRNEQSSTITTTTTTTSTSSSSSNTTSSKTTTTIHSKSIHDEGTSQSHHTNSVVNDLTERLRSLDEMPSVFKRLINVSNFTDKCDESTSASTTTAIKESFNFAAPLNSNAPTNGNDPDESDTGPFYQSTPWPITTRRTKFRITQLSRDVPIGSPDSHQTIFLEEAANTTKDCLLHLLDKYNTKQSRANSSIRRHQSISGHGITDNLEYHSMNSINAFFKRNAFQQNGRTVRKLKARIESSRGDQ